MSAIIASQSGITTVLVGGVYLRMSESPGFLVGDRHLIRKAELAEGVCEGNARENDCCWRFTALGWESVELGAADYMGHDGLLI